MDSSQRDTAFRTINAAIAGQQVVQLKLKNAWRTVEPYLIGLHRVTQELILYGYCRDTVPSYAMPSRWEIFYLNEVDSIELTSYSFLPHIDYNGRIEAVQPVYCRLKPQFDDVTPGHWPIRTPHFSPRKIRLSK